MELIPLTEKAVLLIERETRAMKKLLIPTLREVEEFDKLRNAFFNKSLRHLYRIISPITIPAKIPSPLAKIPLSAKTPYTSTKPITKLAIGPTITPPLKPAPSTPSSLKWGKGYISSDTTQRHEEYCMSAQSTTNESLENIYDNLVTIMNTALKPTIKFGSLTAPIMIAVNTLTSYLTYPYTGFESMVSSATEGLPAQPSYLGSHQET